MYGYRVRVAGRARAGVRGAQRQRRRVPVAGRPVSYAGSAAALQPSVIAPGHARPPRSATEATLCRPSLLDTLGRPLPARSRQRPHKAGGAPGE